MTTVMATLQLSRIRDFLVRFLDGFMEFFFYSYAIAVFNPHMTAPKNWGLYLPVFALLLRIALGRNKDLKHLHGPLTVSALLLCLLVLASAFWSPDAAHTLKAYHQEIGIGILLGLVIAHLLHRPGVPKRMILFMATAGVIIMGVDLQQYWRENQEAGSLYRSISAHYWYSDPFVVSLPFLLAATTLFQNKWLRGIIWTLVVLMVILLIESRTRAAWAAGFATLFLWSWFNKQRWLAVLLPVATLAGLAVLLVLSPQTSEGIQTKLEEGLNMHHRSDLVWPIYADLIADKPIQGYGYGVGIQKQRYKEVVGDDPKYKQDLNSGTHNSTLQIAFAAGIPAAILMWLMYILVLRNGYKAFQQHQDPIIKALLLASLLAFLSHFVWRGLTQNTNWIHLPVLLGTAIFAEHWLRSRIKQADA